MTSTGARLSNAARNLRQIGNSPVSWAIVGVILAIQLVVMLAGGQDVQPARTWFEFLGLNRHGILSGKVWQIATYGVLHGAWWHAGINAILVLLVGSRIEHMAGRGVLVKAALLGVVLGGIFQTMVGPGGQNAPILIGFSGGFTALLLLLTTLSPQSRMMPLPVSGKSLGLGILASALILSLADPVAGIPGFSRFGIWLVGHGFEDLFVMGHACHFGGGLAGWLFGRWLLRPRISLQSLRRDRERREANEAGRAQR